MNFYIDILILLDPEFPATVLMNSLYSKLHKALYDLHSTSIGISFPKYSVTLGNVLRIHGSNTDLKKLGKLNWVGSMDTFCKITEIQEVPKNHQYRIVSRKQASMSQSKLRRLVKRGSIKEDEVANYEKTKNKKDLSEPFLELVSNSNGQHHRRYIDLGQLLDEPKSGTFDSFGLSKNGTIPWF